MMKRVEGLTEREDIAFRMEARLRDVTVAALRREVLAAFADGLLQDPNMAELTRSVMRYRRENGISDVREGAHR